MISRENLYRDMLRLVKAPSVSGTGREYLAAEEIEKLLLEIPYFTENPQMVMRIPIENDPFNRFVIAAFLRAEKKTSDTVILTGHYDVVDTDEYGNLQDMAFDVEALTAAMSRLPLDEETRTDLESGEWYFGRGTADMKFGHALCIEMLRHYSEEKADCNFLYAGVCGEETNSEGMLRAISFFNEFAREQNLKYRLLLLTECFMVDNGEEGCRYVQYGASGKVMPMFFCVGSATHGEEPFLGLDANLLSQEIYKQMHLNPIFCQQNHGITTAPPAGLKQQDLKTCYSLSSPLYAASYFNIATIRMEPENLMKNLIETAETAFENVLDFVKSRVEAFEKLTGTRPKAYTAKPCVKTFQELYAAAEKNYDGDLKNHLQDYAEKLLLENREIQDTCIRLVRHLYEICGEKQPMIIVSVIPPYYPDVNVEPEDCDTKAMLDCIDELSLYAMEKYGEKLRKSEYYGISDLCYTWLAEGMDFDSLFRNLAGADLVYQLPTEDLKAFRVPGVIIGGYGKDLHKYTERLHKGYNFDVLPDLYLTYIDMITKRWREDK